LQVIDLFGGPDRDRTDDLFHAISATSRNSLKSDGTGHTLRTDHTENLLIGPLLALFITDSSVLRLIRT